VFCDGQTNWIVNLDKTDGTLDNITGQREGHKPDLLVSQIQCVGDRKHARVLTVPQSSVDLLLPEIIALLLPVEDRCNQGTDHSVNISVDFFGQCHIGVGKLGHPVATVHHVHLDQMREPG